MLRKDASIAGCVALVVVACGPGLEDASDATSTGAADVSSGGSTSGGSTSGGSAGTSTVDASESSTGVPLPACDPAFDAGLPTGDVVWTRLFSTESDELQMGSAVAVDRSGVVYAAGVLRLPDDRADAWLHAVAHDGEPLWQVRYDGEAGLTDSFSDVALTSAGDVIVVATEETSRVSGSNTGSSEYIVAVLAYTPSGELSWRTEIDAADGERLAGASPIMATGADGRIIVGAATELEGGFPMMFFVDLAPDGVVVERWSPPTEQYRGLEPGDVQLDDAGNLYVVATGRPLPTFGQEDHEWLGRWDASGAFLGAATREHEGARAIAVQPRPDGGTLVLGRIDTQDLAPVARRPFLRGYDAAGAELWAHRIEIESDVTLDPRALAIDCDGGTLVLADFEGTTWLFRLDDDGNEVDRLEIDAGELWSFLALGTDPFGNAVVVGRAYDAGVESFVVQKVAR